MVCSLVHADFLGRYIKCCGATRLGPISATDGSLPADFERVGADLVAGRLPQFATFAMQSELIEQNAIVLNANAAGVQECVKGIRLLPCRSAR